MMRVTDLLDSFYAESLGCAPQDLNAGRLLVVAGDPGCIRFAKGAPLALYAIAKTGASGGEVDAAEVAKARGAVISTRPELVPVVERAVQGAQALDAATCTAIERTVSPLVGVRFWFPGTRLYCEPDGFVDHTSGDVRQLLPEEDERAQRLHRLWGGEVFGQVVEGKVVSWAAVKPLSGMVWDLTIETLPDHRCRGYAKSAVSAALKHVFASGRLAGWGCDRDGEASLCVARSVGFQDYAFDFGCVEG